MTNTWKWTGDASLGGNLAVTGTITSGGGGGNSGVQFIYVSGPTTVVNFALGPIVQIYTNQNTNIQITNFAIWNVLYLSITAGYEPFTITFDSGSFNNIGAVNVVNGESAQYTFFANGDPVLFIQSPITFPINNNEFISLTTPTGQSDNLVLVVKTTEDMYGDSNQLFTVDGNGNVVINGGNFNLNYEYGSITTSSYLGPQLQFEGQDAYLEIGPIGIYMPYSNQGFFVTNGHGESGQVLSSLGGGDGSPQGLSWTDVSVVGGTNQQIQYNNDGSLAGSSVSTDGNNLGINTEYGLYLNGLTDLNWRMGRYTYPNQPFTTQHVGTNGSSAGFFYVFAGGGTEGTGEGFAMGDGPDNRSYFEIDNQGRCWANYALSISGMTPVNGGSGVSLSVMGSSTTSDIADFYNSSNSIVVAIDYQGNLELPVAGLKDSTGALGGSGQILSSTGYSTAWITNTNEFGGISGTITSPCLVGASSTDVLSNVPGTICDFTNGLLTIAPTGSGIGLTVVGDSDNDVIVGIYTYGADGSNGAIFESSGNEGVSFSTEDTDGNQGYFAPGEFIVAARDESIVFFNIFLPGLVVGGGPDDVPIQSWFTNSSPGEYGGTVANNGNGGVYFYTVDSVDNWAAMVPGSLYLNDASNDSFLGFNAYQPGLVVSGDNTYDNIQGWYVTGSPSIYAMAAAFIDTNGAMQINSPATPWNPSAGYSQYNVVTYQGHYYYANAPTMAGDIPGEAIDWTGISTQAPLTITENASELCLALYTNIDFAQDYGMVFYDNGNSGVGFYTADSNSNWVELEPAYFGVGNASDGYLTYNDNLTVCYGSSTGQDIQDWYPYDSDVAVAIDTNGNLRAYAGFFPQQFTFAGQPTGTEGQVGYMIDGCKVGEGTGTGTGIPVFWSAGQSSPGWYTYSTNIIATN